VKKLSFFYFLAFLPIVLNAQTSEQQAVRRVQDHLILRDVSLAVEEAHKYSLIYPDSSILQSVYLRALCELGDEQKAFDALKKLSHMPGNKESERQLFEMMAWGVLNKGEDSSLLMIRLYSLLGAAFTQDARAIPFLLHEMKSSNAFLRSLAVKISANYGDSPLKDQLVQMLKEEKVWYVKLEVIQACGRVRIVESRNSLRDILVNARSIAEERAAALIALTSMYESIEQSELLALIKSDRSGLRELACEIVSHLDMKQYAVDILPLVQDASATVRICCLNALAMLGIKEIDGEPLSKYFKKLFQDPIPEVAITAAWLGTILGEKEGQEVLKKWVQGDRSEWKRLASAAVASSGPHAIDLSRSLLKSEKDIFVKANLCLGLIAQRKDVDISTKFLFSLLVDHGHELWMWENQYNPFFKSLAPSKVRHVDQIPRYPQVVDQHVKLDLLSVLSILGHPKALVAVREFLKDPSWGVTGSAASTLLEEGDEQSLEVVQKLLDDPDEGIRIQAALILAMYGKDASAVKTLQAAYSHVDREMKMHILEALGHIGDSTSIPFLMTVLEDPFQVLRVVAASALIQCIYH
jgi:HEAT repeat protein